MNYEQLKALSVKDLKAKCKAMKLKGYSRLNEEDLIKLILAQTPVDETDELDELLDGTDEDQTDEQPEDLDGDADQTEDESIDETEDQTDEQPEDLDGDADQTDEQPEDLDGDADQTDEQPEDLGPEQDEDDKITFKKLIKGAFGFNGQTFKGSTFDLTADEADNVKIKNAIKNGLIKIK